ncbi:MAG: hypothetical protein REH79_02275 [Spiroplasma sp.]|nr:hypothetical protein [Spiroplasma sp.]
MGLWNFLGGNKIGPGHPRYERAIRQNRETEAEIIKYVSCLIMRDGVEKALEEEGEQNVVAVLKKFPYCPQYPDGWKFVWGKEEQHINHWKLAHKWLRQKKIKEHHDDMTELGLVNNDYTNYIKYLEQRIEKLEKQLKVTEPEKEAN